MKQKLFAAKYVENGFNGVQAANETYDGDYANNKVIASHNLDKPAVIKEINRLLEGVGLDTDSWLAEKLKKSIENGMGQKATQKDAINAINILLRVNDSYPTKKSVSIHAQLNGQLTPKNTSELISSVKSLSVKSQELVEDLQS